ncbi:MAG TPA: Rieske 2Fe-2S domain-containing protein [Caulobacteraceae bacterium]|nr:Rieske 2Fe-2S domain-containing protein [Caulobacteraceae bacterium]
MSADRRAFVAMSVAAMLAPPAARASQAGQTDIGYWDEPIPVGDVRLGDWRIALVEGVPIFLRRRTADEVRQARATPLSDLPEPARDDTRAPGGEWLVVAGVCTHAGCPVQAGLGPYAGWQCFCHGSVYDLSGRIRRGPAKHNLPVIPHQFAAGAITLARPRDFQGAA